MQGFILNANSDKIGEFKDSKLSPSGAWNLKDVKIQKDFVNIADRSTTIPLMFLLVSKKSKNAFDVVDCLGVGLMFSAEGVWCSNSDVTFSTAQFVKMTGKKYEN